MVFEDILGVYQTVSPRSVGVDKNTNINNNLYDFVELFWFGCHGYIKSPALPGFLRVAGGDISLARWVCTVGWLDSNLIMPAEVFPM
jgi:hypothetical protein